MPDKRAILDKLTRHELRISVGAYRLQVGDRRVKAQLADALARARKVQVRKISQDLSRDRLKELCRVFDLDGSGRRKPDLAARLVAPTSAAKLIGRRAPLASTPLAQAPFVWTYGSVALI